MIQVAATLFFASIPLIPTNIRSLEFTLVKYLVRNPQERDSRHNHYLTSMAMCAILRGTGKEAMAGEELVQRYNELKKRERTTRLFTPERTQLTNDLDKLEKEVYALAKELLGEEFYEVLEELIRDKEADNYRWG